MKDLIKLCSTNWKTTLNPLFFGLLGIGLVILVGWQFQIKSGVLTRDVFATVDAPPVLGLLSNIGAFVWASAIAFQLFSISHIKTNGPKSIHAFLVCSVLLTSWLLFDDFFMFHDFWIKHYFGLDEKYAFVGLGIAVISYLFCFRSTILKTNFMLLFLSICFNSLSLVFDHYEGDIGRIVGHWVFLIEDGPKFIGICFWCAYYASVLSQTITGGFETQTDRTK